VITNMKIPVTALYGPDLQIAMGPVLRWVSGWQRHVQLSVGQRWSNKEALGMGWTLRLTCVPHSITLCVPGSAVQSDLWAHELFLLKQGFASHCIPGTRWPQ